jgi:hypothetical protein
MSGRIAVTSSKGFTAFTLDLPTSPAAAAEGIAAIEAPA